MRRIYELKLLRMLIIMKFILEVFSIDLFLSNYMFLKPIYFQNEINNEAIYELISTFNARDDSVLISLFRSA